MCPGEASGVSRTLKHVHLGLQPLELQEDKYLLFKASLPPPVGPGDGPS